MNKYRQLSTVVTDIPQPEKIDSAENEGNPFHSSSIRSDHHTAEVLKNVSPLPFAKHHTG
jgi:hypothetical protein